MTRVVLLILAVLALLWLLRRAFAGRKSAARPRPEAAVPELVACGQCGVHLPRNEALGGDGSVAPATGPFYCCEEHRRTGAGQGEA